MKRKRIAGIACFTAIALIAGCGGGKDMSLNEKKNLAPVEDLTAFGEYSPETWLKPFWYTREVYNETLMFVGEDDEARLLYDADDIIAVLSYGLDMRYEKDRDYTYENGVFKRTADSAIPYWETDDYYRISPDSYSIGVDKSKLNIELSGDRYLKYGEQDTFTSKQIAVTYTHSAVWEGPVPQGKSEKFSKTLAKIKAGEKVKLLFYGDSISTGCNASGTPQGGEVSPYTPSFPDMICEYTKEKYGGEVECVNTAVGGKNVFWGQSELEERVISHAPDMVFVGFGMNDGKTAVDTYKNATEDIIERIHAALPETEIVLIATMLPNYEADYNWCGNQEKFAAALLELEKAYSFVGVANVTEMHKALFEAGKRYRDVTGNNINHPNDFVVRLYAQVLLKTVFGNDFCEEIYE